MASLAGFNAANVDTSDNFAPIPAGDYLVAITDSEQRDTKAGTGSYIRLTLQVLDGPFKGRIVWTNLNLDNPNPKAVEIAQRHLAQICLAVGVPTPNDTVELHGKPLIASVTVREQAGYEPSNDVKKYSEAGSAPAPAAAPVEAAPTPAAAPPAAPAGPQVTAPAWG